MSDLTFTPAAKLARSMGWLQGFVNVQISALSAPL
jgi:hypothetical protein